MATVMLQCIILLVYDQLLYSHGIQKIISIEYIANLEGIHTFYYITFSWLTFSPSFLPSLLPSFLPSSAGGGERDFLSEGSSTLMYNLPRELLNLN